MNDARMKGRHEMISVRYEASGYDGYYDEGCWDDVTEDAEAMDLMQEICDYVSGELGDDEEAEIDFCDEETGDELGHAFVSRDGWQIDPA